jgi:hypothetical protein
MAEFDDKVYKYCPHCDEEYELPEDQELCVICHKPLGDDSDYTLPDEDLSHLF